MMRVADLMTKNVSHIHATEPCSEAAKLMWDCDCGAIPVVDENERGLGMITDRDICMASWSKNLAPSQFPVSQAMSQNLYACSPEDDLLAAENIMRFRQIRRLPVLDDQGRLIGILSLADVARKARPGLDVRNAVRPDELASTLANICEPQVSPPPVW